ncbi:MAG: two-component histidine kinase [Gemmatimonadetes bacterium]|nr:two-component histidine kinase [Gemmatimonadota bacterium]
MRRWHGWALYGAAWIPVALGYTQLLISSRGVPAGDAFLASSWYALSAALLGVLAWNASGRIAWPDRVFVRFLLIQLAMAIAYSVLWDGAMVGYLALRIGVKPTLALARSFAGWQLWSGLWVYGLIAGISYALRITARLREREAATARAEALRMQAELQALRGQLNPHFLFNTLRTVSALLRQDPATARLALERFADLLRYVLDAKRVEMEDVPLATELAFVRDYLSLEQLRLGERLTVIEQIDAEALECLIPSLTLQPLVENAITHAIATRTIPGTITIGASVEGDELTIVIADDGPGAHGEQVRFAPGLGLRVGRQRLETRYANRARFTVTTARGAGFTVTLSLPAEVMAGAPRLGMAALV